MRWTSTLRYKVSSMQQQVIIKCFGYQVTSMANFPKPAIYVDLKENQKLAPAFICFLKVLLHLASVLYEMYIQGQLAKAPNSKLNCVHQMKKGTLCFFLESRIWQWNFALLRPAGTKSKDKFVLKTWTDFYNSSELHKINDSTEMQIVIIKYATHRH